MARPTTRMDNDNTDGIVLIKEKQVTLDASSRHTDVSWGIFAKVIKESTKGMHAATWVADALVRVMWIRVVTSNGRSKRVRKDSRSTNEIDRRNISRKKDRSFPDLDLAKSRYVTPNVVGNSIRDAPIVVFGYIL